MTTMNPPAEATEVARALLTAAWKLWNAGAITADEYTATIAPARRVLGLSA